MAWNITQEDLDVLEEEMQMAGRGKMHDGIVIIKPDAFERGLANTLLRSLLEHFEIIQMKACNFTRDFCKRHYAEHIQKEWYQELENAMADKFIYVFHMRGRTPNFESIRDCCMMLRRTYVDNQYVGPRNLIHCSDSQNSFARESEVWFPAGTR